MTRDDTMGQRIKRRLKVLHMTQEELSAITDISPSHISSIIIGKYNPSIEKILLICSALEVTPNYLLLGTMDLVVDEPHQILEEKIKLLSSDQCLLAADLLEALIKHNPNAKNK